MVLLRTLTGLAVVLSLLLPSAIAQDNGDINARLSELNILRAQTRNLASEYADKKAAYETAKRTYRGDTDGESRLNNAKFQYFLIERKYNRKKEELLNAELALQQLQAERPPLAAQDSVPVSPGTQVGTRPIIFEGPSNDDEIERLNAALDERERRIDELLSQLETLKARPQTADTAAAAASAAPATPDSNNGAQVADLRGEISRLSTQVDDYEAEIDVLRNRVAFLLGERDEYEERIRASEAKATELARAAEQPPLAPAPPQVKEPLIVRSDATTASTEPCDCDDEIQGLTPAFIVARDTGMSAEQRARLSRVINSRSSGTAREINLYYPGPNTYQLWQGLQYLGEDMYRADATVIKGKLQIRIGDWYWQSEIASADHQKNVSFFLDTRGNRAQLFIHRNNEAVLALR